MRVLVLNPGSSTLKASMIDTDTEASDPHAETTLDWPPDDQRADALFEQARGIVGDAADAIGYRVVHGGARYQRSARVDEALIATVEVLDALAPIHNRRAAAIMRAGRTALSDVPQVACFDTAFHTSLPEAAWRYAVPEEWVERWTIRRYGFHGLSVAWSVRRAAELLGRSVDELGFVVAHLGSGCSVTAVHHGRSVETSMGFTPYEGLMMGTRSGSVDPGILLHLTRSGLAVDEMAEGLAQRSGLAAIGGTSDVRELLTRAASGDAGATLALDMFVRRAAAGIAASATTLQNLDALVFTGGIGQHAAEVRAEIVARLSLLGVPNDLSDRAPDAVLAEGPPAVLAIAAREDRVIAEEVAGMLSVAR